MPRPQPSAAFFEDADEDGNVMADSRRYAKSTIASAPGSPVKQQMNTGKKKASRRTELSSPEESDSTEHASGSSRHKSKDKRHSVSRSKGKEPEKQRPIVRSSKTAPSRTVRHHDEASYYGMADHHTIPASSRPRALTSRPQTYYGQRPPLSQSAYYPPGPQAPPTSYPPPPWLGGPLLGSSPLASSPMAHPEDYFARGSDALASRFARGEQHHRPSSAMGHHVGSHGSIYDYDAPPPPQKLVARKPSLSTRPSKEQKDRGLMPPPPPVRSQTTQPRQAFKPPPPPQQQQQQQQHSHPRKSVGFDEDDFSEADARLYRDVDRRGSIDFTKMPIRSKRHSLGPEYFEDDDYSIEPAASKSSRRENRRSASYQLDDQVKNASRYLEATGGTSTALTNENLRRIKNGGSSRSTRSTASRDESSFKQSAATRTTRSSSNDDDITIKVPSGAVVEVGNAKINCTNGGEINIGRGGGGSERGTVYDDDGRSRAPKSERPSNRTRTSSQSVHSRRPRALLGAHPEDHAQYPERHGPTYSEHHAPSYPFHDYTYAPRYPVAYPGTHYDESDYDD
ncbi:hypothetical protein BKA67DRAFT_223431 [Truncatella angustata]|uniref:Uncharacterized protein n=1 Tax=Truncatella angustata TaxID=152316 RepID=A0A9P8ZYH0_9PEZI|nr:uncharacterized protein BKA67DRAFT_223431 [Truncatella angustata]KAH6655013.1 hypothetical protein BKA67DRAFT_223431 [Truncatella angustata]KAH8204103.1 hypothetical protein TruAng_001785 [Truncatella angustata]